MMMSRMFAVVVLAALAAAVGAGAAAAASGPFGDGPTPTTANCTLTWYNQTTDHFQWRPSGTAEEPLTFQQRVFICDQYWDKTNPGPIFFYAGNEGDVELYVNHTGLMWESAPMFRALLVFAEHRFYGKTQLTPGASGPSEHQYKYLTHDQAMADYAHLLYHLKRDRNCESSKTIVFGGSYGGMLAAWLRMKYPQTFDGAIAASAPILAFPGMTPPFDSNGYWQVVTRDATPAAGAAPACENNMRNAWKELFSRGKTESGRKSLSTLFRTCSPVTSEDDTWRLAMFLLLSIDTLAMGNYPYPSNYLTGGGPKLPAYPVVAACKPLAKKDLKGDALLSALRDGAAVYANATQDLTCFDIPDQKHVEQDGIWDYQWCTELMPQETYFSLNGTTDMFWAQPQDMAFVRDHCRTKYGIVPREDWMAVKYGGLNALPAASNIVFSNGLLDPWSSGGVKHNISDSITAIILPHGAHHIDLFFTNPQDTWDITWARNYHRAQIAKWLDG
ncbi:hypothetical protein PTSG_06225 [Salpingoeca rosetta]|uniref:Lysosomal Pro-X carboxypeptidase n=1 Tax=Salpingoeca rosetta (strain ATCC 50818 / BSB-021) TaxID=946362 RepID=F2UCA7_SALR5|nr:uncharacterized protein PTSG_06225 [Salpingoeca rosetta]EGD74214.1 hypothetical protein PTSG_06225 [Salpingoeca rosetta]|eukprot:XP_004993114.1 hypothetical protein PTSG_06225 [Salpingoeca rosetta]